MQAAGTTQKTQKKCLSSLQIPQVRSESSQSGGETDIQSIKSACRVKY